MSTATVSISLLDRAIDVTRSQMRQATSPQSKMRTLWAGAKHARNFGATDVVAEDFIALGLEFRNQLGRHADQDVPHVVSWACRDLNPFGDK